MSRRTFALTVTVDVDDPDALASALLEGKSELSVDVLGAPTADEAISDLLVDAIRDHAAPGLEQHGVHVVGIGSSCSE